MNVFIHKTAFPLLAILLFCLPANAQPWTFTGPGNWDDPTKWSPGYPGLNIAFSTVTLNGDCDLGSNTINFSGGVIDNNGTLSASGGTLHMTGGILSNSGTIVHVGAGGLTFSMPGGGNLNNSGTLTFNADFFCGGVIINNSGGQMNVNAVVSNYAGDNGGTISGSGTLSFGGNSSNAFGATLGSAGLTIAQAAGTLTNAGTLHFYQNFTLNSGTLHNTFGTVTIHPGVSFNKNAGGTLNLGASTLHINGTLNFNDGSIFPENGAAIAIGSGGALNLNNGSEFGVNPGVTLDNAGTISSTSGTGTLSIGGGTVNNTGTVTHNTAALTLSLTSGTLNNNSGGILNLHSNLSAASMLIQAAGATINVNNAATFTVPNGSTFANAGTLKSAAGQTGFLSIVSGGTFNNTGTVDNGGASGLTVQLNGTFNNQSGGTFSLAQNFTASVGSFTNAAGAIFNLGSSQLNLSGSHVFNHSGTVSGSGGSVWVNGAAFNNYGTFTHSASTQLVMSSGTFTNSPGSTLTLNSTLSMTGGTLDNSGTMHLNANLDFVGNFINQATGTLVLNAMLSPNPSGIFEQKGTLSGTSGTLKMMGGGVRNYASMDASPGSWLTLDYSSGGIFWNHGGGTLSIGDQTLNSTSQLHNYAGATLNIASGKTLTLNASASFYDYGTMAASGNLAVAGGSFYLDGAALSHSSAGLNISFTAGIFRLQNGGALTLNSDFTIPASRTLQMSETASSVSNYASLTVAGFFYAWEGTFSNHGTVTVNVGANFRSSGIINQAAGLFQNNGAVYSAYSFPIPTMNVTGGIFRNNTNATNWLSVGGNFGVNVVLPSGGRLENTAGGVIRVVQNWSVNGVIDNAGSILYYNDITMTLQNGATLTNSGTFSLNGSSRTLALNAATCSFTNTNTGTVTVPSGSSLSIVNGAFHNNGTYNSPNGSSLFVSGGAFNNNATFTGGGYVQPGSPSGVFNNNSGATMTLGAQMGLNHATIQINTNGTFNNGGPLTAVNGFLKIVGGTYNNSANVAFGQSGASITFDFQSGAVHNLAGTMTFHGTFSQPTGANVFVNHAGATVEALSYFYLLPGTTFTNQGIFSRNSTLTCAVHGGAVFLNEGTCTFNNYTGFTSSEFRNNGGTATFTGTFSSSSYSNPCFVNNLNGGELNLNVAVNNSSAVNWTNAAGCTLHLLGNWSHWSGTVANSGDLNLNTHSLANDATITNSSTGILHTGTGVLNAASGSFSNDGIIKGEGEILSAGGFFNGSASQFQPGSSPGALTITGDHVHSGATYTCEIDGTAQGTGYDWLDVSGTATLTSSSKLHLVFGYAAYDGTTFDVLTAGSVSGTFDLSNITFSNTGAGNVTGVSVTYPGGNVVRVMASSALLPVELLDFQAFAEGEKVRLRWSTASERNADRFEVEHSEDGVSFEKIGERQAAGTTVSEQHYSLLHERPVAGVNYYRLRQVDFDGKEGFSKVVAIDFRPESRDGNLGLRAFPNPVSSGGGLTLLLPKDFEGTNATLRLFSDNGQLLREQPDPAAPEVKMDMAGLPVGVYTIELVSGRAARQVRVVVQ